MGLFGIFAYVVKLAPSSCVGVSGGDSPGLFAVLYVKAFVVQVDNALACDIGRSSHNFIIHEYLCCLNAFGFFKDHFFRISYRINRWCSKGMLFRKEFGVQFELDVHGVLLDLDSC